MVALTESDISIVVPIKNMEGRLSNLMEWLADAIKNELEVVLVFDGCDDLTKSEIESHGFAEGHNLKFIDTPGIGPGGARNLGLKAATRSWVVFWDSDDVGDVAALQNTISNGTNPNTQICICRYQIASLGLNATSINLITPPINTNIESALLNPAVWRMIFKREFIKECNFGTMNIGEDQVFLADALSKEPTIQFLEKSVYTYFQGLPEQLTAKKLDPKAILTSISEVKQKIPNCRKSSQQLLYLIILKMSFTLLKRMHLTKFIRVILTLLFNSGAIRSRSSLMYLSRALFLILRTKRVRFAH
jgi:glycosyltransferase involved in cell wall biosynthesis